MQSTSARGSSPRNSSAQRTRIVFFDEAVAFGGSVVVLAHLLDNLDRTRFQPFVVTSLDAPSIRKLFRSEDVLCWFQPRLSYAHRIRWMSKCPISAEWARRLWAYLFTGIAFLANLPGHIRLFAKVWLTHPDIIHVNNGREGLMAAKFFRFPFVLHFHGMTHGFIYGTYDVRFAAAAFVSISKFITDEAIKLGVPADRITDIPNPAPRFERSEVDRAAWRSKFGLKDEMVAFAHVARVIRWKGQLEFLQAFAIAAPKCPDAVALIVGDDVEGLSAEYPKSLRAVVAEAGLQDRVIFTGHVENIVSLMSAMDVVVHSSIDPEPFGLVITEAMAAGTAVIAARLGAPIEIVEHGVSGLLVDPKDSIEFAHAIESLAKDPQTRQKLGEEGQRMARTRYAPELFAERIQAVYDAILQRQA